MKTIINKNSPLFIVMLITAITNFSCKEIDIKNNHEIITKSVSDITSTSASIVGEISDLESGVVDYGILYSTTPNTNEGNKVSLGKPTRAGLFSVTLTKLQAGTKYYVCAYFFYNDKLICGEEFSFTTLSKPFLNTSRATDITTSTATVGGIVTEDGGTAVIERGVYWKLKGSIDTIGTKLQIGAGIGPFSVILKDITPNITYTYKAYAINSIGVAFGNETNFSLAVTSIGSTYQGGIVFYIDINGQHGLVCALSDQDSDAIWGCQGETIIGADDSGLGSGKRNTTDIVNGCNASGIAAQICYNLELNGYSDWYLPSKDELNLMYANLKKTGIGGFANSTYWCSTEYSANHCWFQDFANGFQSADTYKDDERHVRAIRAF